MKIDIKTILNILVFVFISFLFIGVQSTVLPSLFPGYLVPDLLSCMLIYVGIKRGLREGIVSVLFLSYMVALNSGMGFFPCLVVYLMCFGLAKYIGFNIFTGTARSVFLGTFFCAGIPKLVFAIWFKWADYYSLLRMIPGTLLSALVTAFVSLFLFRLFSFIDMRTERMEPEYIAEKHRRF